ncbi:MAG: flagellar biosynthesis anti-sigma factor FlgM [Deltaproteobacteria bacterium]|nr:flagellar biosynthesis anti-sigma factor FlgM [Deltaproteobacteria bacterium]
MKIDDRVSTYMALLHSAAVKPQPQPVGKSAPAPKAIAEAPPAAVELSSTAVQLADDEARRERLNVIRQQLAEGSYNISGKDVADKILNVLKG